MLTALTQKILDENPDLKQKWTSLIPQGKMGQPQDLMGPVTFLLSNASQPGASEFGPRRASLRGSGRSREGWPEWQRPHRRRHVPREHRSTMLVFARPVPRFPSPVRSYAGAVCPPGGGFASGTCEVAVQGVVPSNFSSDDPALVLDLCLIPGSAGLDCR
ncbi:hypothetical protein CDD83_1959 [Cordyceps sp. RAO-2017]|nr:hypothetical protein CDD83_1959 [Cordyceps sp. RAO-2017]